MSYESWLSGLGVDIGFADDVSTVSGTIYGAMRDPTGGPGTGLAGCYEFDGVDDYISIPTNSNINYGPTDTSSHGVWVKLPSVSNSDAWAPAFSKGADHYEFRHIDTLDELHFSAGANLGATDFSPTKEEWVFYVATYVIDGANCIQSLYRRTASDQTMQFLHNYTVETSHTAAHASGGTPNNSPLILGCRGGTERFFHGNIAGYFSTSFALSTVQMDAGYAAAFAVTEADYSNPNAVGWRYENDNVIPVFVHAGSEFA